MIYSYFSLKIWSDVFDCFWLLFWSRSCLKSSGRLLGTISTKFHANPKKENRKILRKIAKHKEKYYFMIFLRFFCNFEFQFFSSNCLIFQFFTSDSNSTGRNPPRAHLRMSENLHFEISAPLDEIGFQHKGG